jgi:dihydrofolate reductase
MGKVILGTMLTLDGVMQAPGQPDEDLRGGFEHGGWQRQYADPVMGRAIGESMGTSAGLLLGRRTYESFAAFWPSQSSDNPIAAMMNGVQKFVASTTLREPLPWSNSTLLKGDVVEAVAELKRGQIKDLQVVGSGDLAQTLIRHRLVDRYVLFIHPLVVGSGRRLFEPGGSTVPLRLVDSSTTTTGVLIATYEPAG